METEVHTSVDISLLYNLLLESFVYDINSAGKDITLEELSKGFEYEKVLYTKMGSERHVRMKITNLVKNKNISFDVIENNGCTSVSYELFTCKEGTEIVYSENFVGNKQLNNLNQKIMMIPFSYFAKRNFKKKIKIMEKNIMCRV